VLKNLHILFDAARFLRIISIVPAEQNDPLSRRERQIMDIIWRTGRASANEVHDSLTDAPSYSAVRALLTVLVTKGHLRHERDGKRYVYLPTSSPEKASKSALKRILSTFFNNSPADLVATLLDPKDVDDVELARIKAMIDERKKS
jgi:BlaI family transcriptional regulator, penicillinase repressor